MADVTKIKLDPADAVTPDQAKVDAINLNSNLTAKRIARLDAVKVLAKTRIQDKIDTVQKEIIVLFDMWENGDIDNEKALENYIDKQLLLKALQGI